ncbi:xylulose 5-phosphate/phosphate translocator, chloroplastic [Iris pallida]|uniref:Xylulose 5-phosphate/phosphate translocator, chloroplastic n=1 Tax=Iris pallida TaxID=29817 RepID=A0AAX6GA22_IRIPA|nr:xylulose 5-phosphate/phosphate translocator, chloroplastic [Iris pallida]
MFSSLLSPSSPFPSIVQTRLAKPHPPIHRPNLHLPLLLANKTHSTKPKSSIFINTTRASASASSFSGDRGRREEEEENQEVIKPIIITPAPAAPAPAAPAPAAEAEEEEEGGMNAQLAVVFGLWYFQNVVFNIYNKKVLNVFPYPWLLASFQLLVGSLWMSSLWLARLQPFPEASPRFLLALLGPALFHAVGHISACVSFSKVAVSFTHVIKSSEPVFSVAFSSLLGRSYPLPVWLSVLLIVLGCSLAAVTEVTFNLAGLSGALLSNVGFVLRNIYSKKSLQSFRHVDGLNLYGWISVLSFLYLFPVAVLVEGAHWALGLRQALAAVDAPWRLYWWVAVSGVFYHLYNQSSYQALDKISPLTFSVGNTMKRVVVIVASVLVFRNPIRPLNALGSAIAVLGTFLYSQATTAKKKDIGEVAKNKAS